MSRTSRPVWAAVTARLPARPTVMPRRSGVVTSRIRRPACSMRRGDCRVELPEPVADVAVQHRHAVEGRGVGVVGQAGHHAERLDAGSAAARRRWASSCVGPPEAGAAVGGGRRGHGADGRPRGPRASVASRLGAPSASRSLRKATSSPMTMPTRRPAARLSLRLGLDGDVGTSAASMTVPASTCTDPSWARSVRMADSLASTTASCESSRSARAHRGAVPASARGAWPGCRPVRSAGSRARP